MTAAIPARPRRAARPGPRPTTKRRRVRLSPAGVAWTLAALAVAVLWLVPLLWAFTTSLKPEAETTALPVRWLPDAPTLAAYAEVLGRGDILRWLLNSTVVATLVTALTLVCCALAAFGFSRTDFPGRRWCYAAFLAGILVPPQVLVVPLFNQMSALGLVDTYWGVALPQVAAPVMVFVLKRFFDGIPREYEEAARLDGAGHLRVLWSVVLPMSVPILSAVGIFTFVAAWNNFLWPFIVTTDPDLMTLPVGLGSVQGAYGIQYAENMAAAVLGAVPLLIVFAVLQRHVVRGVGDVGLR
ncbi:carbohydrate ABC transporter permease [Marinactinospora rubrisoli]|uniref:Carbohydrate ABC transporter permease n=1 Tax=Marinactinospora rubrisoli TaxID=2715399 RepID=A0ABW2KGF6_9ACTN